MGEEEGGEETHAYARTGLAHGNTSQVTLESDLRGLAVRVTSRCEGKGGQEVAATE